MKNNKFVAFFLFFILTILYPKDKIFFATSLDPSISFGRDSNVMRFSQNEIDQMALTSYLLPPNNISSRFIKFSTTFRFYSKSTLLSYMFNNRRTNFSISGNYTLNIDHNRKSSKNFSFKIDQQLGNYKHIYIGYFIMPNYYLREYEDLDLSVTIYEMYEQILSEIEDEYGCYTNQCEEYNDVLTSYENAVQSKINPLIYSSAVFDLERLSLAYEFPIKNKYSKLKFGIKYDKQLYNSIFTEYDLKIKGRFIQFSFNPNKHKFAIYYDNQDAENYTYLDGNYSTEVMDRSYKENRTKLSITESFDRKRSFGIIADIHKRKNTSSILNDKLHFQREHEDATISIWYKINNHKFMVSYRTRNTSSPYQWVIDLKTFKRYIFTYTIIFNRIKFN